MMAFFLYTHYITLDANKNVEKTARKNQGEIELNLMERNSSVSGPPFANQLLKIFDRQEVLFIPLHEFVSKPMGNYTNLD